MIASTVTSSQGAATTGSDAVLACMEKLCVFIESKGAAPDSPLEESLFPGLGALTLQADMLKQVEQIPNKSEEQIRLLEELNVEASKMIQLVDDAITELSPKPQTEH